MNIIDFPNELLLLFVNHLTLLDLRNFQLISKKVNSINIDWDTYFKFHNHNILYNNVLIDKEFIKSQGKYLMNINDERIISQWFKFYPIISNLNIDEIFRNISGNQCDANYLTSIDYVQTINPIDRFVGVRFRKNESGDFTYEDFNCKLLLQNWLIECEKLSNSLHSSMKYTLSTRHIYHILIWINSFQTTRYSYY